MVLHIGKDTMVPLKDVILILDYKEARSNDDTNNFLKKISDSAHNIYIEKYNIKSVVIAKFLDKFFIYYSPISPATLYKRSKN
ncbi:MAG: DUF370 domain-containing protein [Eubacteriales bacterium]|nr:DUF370 domain-containing protein [Eubacteriales bacterium]